MEGRAEEAAYFGHRSCKDNYFVELADSLHEVVHSGTLYDVDVVVLTLDLDGNGEVCLM